VGADRSGPEALLARLTQPATTQEKKGARTGPLCVGYAVGEGLDQAPRVQIEITAAEFRRARARREWLMIGLALSEMAIVVAVSAMVDNGEPAATPAATPKPLAAPTANPAAPTLADAKGIAFEKFTKVTRRCPPSRPAPSRSSRSTSSST
jgi:hypothetical protein